MFQKWSHSTGAMIRSTIPSEHERPLQHIANLSKVVLEHFKPRTQRAAIIGIGNRSSKRVFHNSCSRTRTMVFKDAFALP